MSADQERGEHGSTGNSGPNPLVTAAPLPGSASPRDSAHTAFLTGCSPDSPGRVALPIDAAWRFIILPFVDGCLRAGTARALEEREESLRFEDVLSVARTGLHKALTNGIGYEERAPWAFTMFLISLCCGCARNAIRAERTLSGHGPKVVKKVSDGQLRDDGLMILSDRPEDEDMFGDITWTQVQAAIDALPPRQRQVILEDLAKIPVWKTAERMKLTPARIYQLKQKALEALRTALENPGTE